MEGLFKRPGNIRYLFRIVKRFRKVFGFVVHTIKSLCSLRLIAPGEKLWFDPPVVKNPHRIDVCLELLSELKRIFRA